MSSSESSPKNGRLFSTLSGPLLRHIFFAIMGSFHFGYSISSIASFLPILTRDFLWCKDMNTSYCDEMKISNTFIAAALYLAAAVGGFTSSHFIRQNRLVMSCIGHVAFICGGVLGLTAFHVWQLILSRLFSGFGMGVVSVITPLFLSEISSNKQRGVVTNFHQVGISLGLLAGGLVGILPPAETTYFFPVIYKIWWRCIFAIPIVISTIYLLFEIFVYRDLSPVYYVEMGDIDSAKAKLKELLGSEDVEEHLEEIMRSEENRKELSASGVGFKSLFEAKYRLMFAVGLGVAIFQQLTGINFFLSTAGEILAHSGLSNMNVSLSNAAMNLILLIGAVCSGLLVDRKGRRFLFISGMAIEASGLFIPVIASTFAADASVLRMIKLFSILFYCFGFSLGWASIPYVYLAEVFSREVQGVAFLACFTTLWLSSCVSIFLPLFTSRENLFIMFFVICIAGLVFSIFGVRETKGLPFGVSPYAVEKESELVVS